MHFSILKMTGLLLKDRTAQSYDKITACWRKRPSRAFLVYFHTDCPSLCFENEKVGTLFKVFWGDKTEEEIPQGSFLGPQQFSSSFRNFLISPHPGIRSLSF